MPEKDITPLLQKTKTAAVALRGAKDTVIKKAVSALAELLIANTDTLIKANKKDLALQAADNPRNDRLMLNAARIQAIANSLLQVGKLPNPTGKMLENKTLPNGLLLQKITVPMGVIGVIYESRPNVTFDVAALCLRSQNACVLKGSSEAAHTNIAALRLIHQAFTSAGLPKDCVALLPAARAYTTQLLAAEKFVDLIIPRGSAGLIQYVRQHSRIPVIETGAGVCHVYVHEKADIKKAVAIAVNAKTSRPGVCNAADAILVDAAVAAPFFAQLQPELERYPVKIFAEKKAARYLKNYPYLQAADDAAFDTEYMSLACAVKVVKDIDEALQHISRHSTKHSEAIISKDKNACNRFMQEVDAAAVYANASTRFTDGEEFGLGAEIGISTQKLHARGPFALEKLVTEKWLITGNGEVR